MAFNGAGDYSFPYRLANDQDVNISNPANGQVLVYNSTTGLWVNTSNLLVNPSTGVVTTHNNTLDDGSGNETINGNITITGVAAPTLALTPNGTSSAAALSFNPVGNSYSATTPQWVISGSRYYGGSTTTNFVIYSYDGTNSYNVFSLTYPKTVATANNTLDDGSGNISISGIGLFYGNNFTPTSNTNATLQIGNASHYLSYGGGILMRDGTYWAGLWTNSNGATLEFGVAGTSSGFTVIPLSLSNTGSGSVSTSHNTLDDGSGNLTTSASLQSSGYLYVDQYMKATGAGAVIQLPSFTSSTTTEVDIILDGNSGGTGANAQKYYWARVAAGSHGRLANANYIIVVYDGTNYWQPLIFDYTDKAVQVGDSGWQTLTANNTLDDGSGNIIAAGNIYPGHSGTTQSSNYITATSTILGVTTSNGSIGLGTGVSGYTLNIAGNVITTSGGNTLDNGSGNLSAAGSVTGKNIIITVNGTGDTAQLVANQNYSILAGGVVYLQSTTTNSNSEFDVAPNGTSTSAAVTVLNTSSTTAQSNLSLYITSTIAYIQSSNFGGGSVLPLYLTVGTHNAVEISTAGAVTTLHNTLDDASGNATVATRLNLPTNGEVILIAGSTALASVSASISMASGSSVLISYTGSTNTTQIGPAGQNVAFQYWVHGITSGTAMELLDTGNSNAIALAINTANVTISTSYILSYGTVHAGSDSRLKPDFQSYIGNPIEELKKARFGMHRKWADPGRKEYDLGRFKAAVAAETLPTTVASQDEYGIWGVDEPRYSHWIVGVLKAQQEEIEKLKEELRKCQT
jgi:hypothetical protein